MSLLRARTSCREQQIPLNVGRRTPDGIQTGVLKDEAHTCATATTIIWTILIEGVFNRKWKVPRIVLIIKRKAYSTTLSAYRAPIHLGCWTLFQWGFMEGHSTIRAVSEIVETLQTRREEGLYLDKIGRHSWCAREQIPHVFVPVANDTKLSMWQAVGLWHHRRTAYKNDHSRSSVGPMVDADLWNVLYYRILHMELPPDACTDHNKFLDSQRRVYQVMKGLITYIHRGA